MRGGVKNLPKLLVAAALLMALAFAAADPAVADSRTLRIGLADDPDMLDPTTARTYTGRIVFAALCDKLVDITPELDIAPQLAAEWKWVDDNKGLVLETCGKGSSSKTASRSMPRPSNSASSAISTCRARTARPRSAR